MSTTCIFSWTIQVWSAPYNKNLNNWRSDHWDKKDFGEISRAWLILKASVLQRWYHSGLWKLWRISAISSPNMLETWRESTKHMCLEHDKKLVIVFQDLRWSKRTNRYWANQCIKKCWTKSALSRKKRYGIDTISSSTSTSSYWTKMTETSLKSIRRTLRFSYLTNSQSTKHAHFQQPAKLFFRAFLASSLYIFTHL